MTVLQYVTFRVKNGWMGVLVSPRGLLQVVLPQTSAQEVRRLFGDKGRTATPAPDIFQDLVLRFKAYFTGERVLFNEELDLAGATAFQRQVWQKTKIIPHGETRSYHWVAEQTGHPRAVRAVGQALAKNPLPIVIPCHRVLASNGRLCGFAGGLDMKSFLISLEKSGS